MAAAEVPESARPAGAPTSAAPGARLVAGFVLCLLLPFLAAAIFPALPEVWRGYLLALPLAEQVVAVALVFALLGLPLFAAPDRRDVNAGLCGVFRGLTLGCLAAPFLVLACPVSPVSAGTVLSWAALVVATAAGAAAGATFGSRGAAAMIALACLPGLAGFLATDTCPAMGWLETVSPFCATEVAREGSAAWPLGLLPGLAVLGTAFAVRAPD